MTIRSGAMAIREGLVCGIERSRIEPRWFGRGLLVVLAGVFLVCNFASAQRVTPSNLFRIDVFKPEFETADYTFPTSALVFSVRQGIEGPVSLEVKVPLAYVGEDGATGSDWEFRAGNPYLGLSWGSARHPAELGFGLRAPILPNDARIRIMRIADIHQYEAFVPDLWTFSMHSVVGGDTDPAQARSALNFWFPLHNDFEVVADYSLTLRRPVAGLLVGIQVRGRAGLTSDNLVFGERTMHEAGAILEFPVQNVRPGLLIRTPIQGREVVDWVVGISLSAH